MNASGSESMMSPVRDQYESRPRYFVVEKRYVQPGGYAVGWHGDPSKGEPRAPIAGAKLIWDSLTLKENGCSQSQIASNSAASATYTDTVMVAVNGEQGCNNPRVTVLFNAKSMLWIARTASATALNGNQSYPCLSRKPEACACLYKYQPQMGRFQLSVIYDYFSKIKDTSKLWRNQSHVLS